MTDPIADMLTRIRNGQMAKKQKVQIPFSKLKFRIAEIMKQEGYVGDIEKQEGQNAFFIVTLLYTASKRPKITEIKRESTPGHRKYCASQEIPSVLNGYGLVVLSTPKGIMTGKQAKKQGFGGELLCSLF